MSDTQGEQQRREHFRIDYPKLNCARIVVLSREFPIIDISQHGIKLLNNCGFDFQEGTEFKGAVQLLCGVSVVVSARVLRCQDDDIVVLYLDEGIPLKLMYDEHRFLIKNVPT